MTDRTPHPSAAGRTIRGNAGLVWLVVTGAAVLGLLIDVLVRGGAVDLLLIAPWMLLPVWVVWAFLASPRLRADAEGVSIRNPLRTTSGPWSSVEDLAMRWQVEVRFVGGRTVQAWSVAARKANPRNPEQPAERELEILRELREAAAPSALAPVPTVRWNADILLVLAALIVWAAVAVVVTR